MAKTKPENTDVVIIAGGKGTRLRTITKGLPKVMLKIGGYSFLDILINYMINFGFKRFILCVGYKGEVIKKYYRKNKRQNVTMVFSSEREPLDTGGALKKAERLIQSNPFVVLNGDSFCEFNAPDLLRFHKENRALITMVLAKVSNSEDYGMVELDSSSRIVSFKEKNKGVNFAPRSRSGVKRYLINAGVYVFNKRIFRLMPALKKFSLERDFFPRMVNDNFYGYPLDKFFMDIGTPERYRKALKSEKNFQKILNRGELERTG